MIKYFPSWLSIRPEMINLKGKQENAREGEIL